MNFNVTNWLPIMAFLVGPSVMMIAISLILVGFAPKRAEEAKGQIPTIIFGVILFSLVGGIAAAVMQSAGAAGGGGADGSLPPVEAMVEAGRYMFGV